MAWAPGYPIDFTATGDKTKDAIYKACIQEIDKIYAHLNITRTKFDSDASLNIVGDVDTVGELPTTALVGDIYNVNGVFYMWYNSRWNMLGDAGFPVTSETETGVARVGTFDNVMQDITRETGVVTEEVLKRTGYIAGVDVPRGCVISWFGNINVLPTGWALCDGSNGTPDYRGFFLRGSVDGTLGTGGEDITVLDNSSLIAHTHALGTLINVQPHVHDVEGYTSYADAKHSHVASLGAMSSEPSGLHDHNRHVVAYSGNYPMNSKGPSGFTGGRSVPYSIYIDVPQSGQHSHSVNMTPEVGNYAANHDHAVYGTSGTNEDVTLVYRGTTDETGTEGTKEFNNMPVHMNLVYLMKI
jgi:hypothetical protein